MFFFRNSHRKKKAKVQPTRSRRCAVETLEPRMVLSTVAWTGGGGSNNAWSYGPNWSSSPNPPGTSDDVIIGAAQTVDLDISTTVNSLQIQSGGTLEMLAGNNLTVENGLTNQGTLKMDGDRQTLTVSSGQFLNAGTVEYDQGSNAYGTIVAAMQNTGTLRDNQGWLCINVAKNAAGAETAVGPSYTFANTGTIEVNGARCTRYASAGWPVPATSARRSREPALSRSPRIHGH